MKKIFFSISGKSLSDGDSSHKDVIQKLQTLRDVPLRDPQAEKQARAAYLSQASQLRSSVSQPKVFRLNQWINTLIRKGNLKMSALAPIMILLVILFGGTGAAAYAAQDSLPDSSLYPVKLMIEDFRTGITFSDPSRLELQLQLANRRMEEFAAQLSSGGTPTEALMSRWEQHIRECFKIAANQSDQDMARSMQQIRESVRTQEKTILLLSADGKNLKYVSRLQEKLHLYLSLANSAEKEPVQSRQTIQNMLRVGSLQGSASPSVTPVQEQKQIREQERNSGPQATPSLKPSECSNCTSMPAKAGGNPWTDGTPTPGSGYGSGEVQNPFASGTPTPKSGYGPGPGPTQPADPTPAGGIKPVEPPKTGPTAAAPQPPAPQPPSGNSQPQPQPTVGPKGNGK